MRNGKFDGFLEVRDGDANMIEADDVFVGDIQRLFGRHGLILGIAGGGILRIGQASHHMPTPR